MADVIARMADGIAMLLMFLPLIIFCFVGRCYCLVADVLPLLCSFVLLADVVAW